MIGEWWENQACCDVNVCECCECDVNEAVGQVVVVMSCGLCYGCV